MLGKLRLSFNGLRPFLDWIPSDEEGKLKVIAARLSHFKPLLDSFITSVESSYPLFQLRSMNNLKSV